MRINVGSQNDVKVSAVRETIHDLWGHADNGTWDSNAALEVPILAAEKGYFTVMNLTTTPRLAGPMPLAILIRNQADIAALYNKTPEKLSQIGVGKRYPDLQEFYKAIMQAIGSGVHNGFELVTPPHVVTITTRNQQIYNKIKNL